MAKLDDLILGFYTKLSHRFQILTGRTNFFLARICLFVVLIDISLTALTYWIPILKNGPRINGIGLIFLLLGLIFYFFLLNVCQRIEDDMIDQAMSRQFLERMTDRPIRLFAIVVCLITSPYLLINALLNYYLFDAIDCLGFPSFTSYLYLIAVVPLPPGRSRVRNKFGHKVLAFAKATSPKA